MSLLWIGLAALTLAGTALYVRKTYREHQHIKRTIFGEDQKDGQLLILSAPIAVSGISDSLLACITGVRFVATWAPHSAAIRRDDDYYLNTDTVGSRRAQPGSGRILAVYDRHDCQWMFAQFEGHDVAQGYRLASSHRKARFLGTFLDTLSV